MDKTCKICNETKDSLDFYPRHGSCKICTNEKKRNARKVTNLNKLENIEEQAQTLKKDFVAEIKQADIKVLKPKKEVQPPIDINKKEIEFIKENLKLLILGGFSLVALKTKQEHWNITEIEADNIASPTMNILSKMDKFKEYAKYSDVIALGVAVTATIVPRILMTKSSPTMEEVNKNDRSQESNGTASKQDKPVDRSSNKKDAPSVNNKSIFSEIQESIM